MKRLLIPVCALSLLAATAAASLAGVSAAGKGCNISSGTASLAVNASGGTSLNLGGVNSGILPAAVDIRDGRRGDAPVALARPGNAVISGSVLTRRYSAKSAPLDVTEQYRTSGKYIFCKVSIRNRGEKQAWLKVNFSLPVKLKGADVTYWDGLSAREKFSGKAANERLYATFPLAALYGREGGLALGIAADQIFSYIENSASYTNGGKLSYGVKMVLDPGQSDSAEFIIFGFTPDYGYLNAVDSYYKAYPAAFAPTPGIDPGITSTGLAEGMNYVAEGKFGDNLDPYRRSFSGIMWVYAPFKKAGDYFGSEEEWAVPLKNQEKVAPQFKSTAAAYIAERDRFMKELTLSGGTPMFYVINWCENDLANRKYPEQILKRSDGTPNILEPWVHAYTADTCMWWGGKYGAHARDEFAKIVKNVWLSGFALDCADGKMKAREFNDLTGFPGRAYDDQGVFCQETVGVARMVDYMHTLKRDGRPMGVWPNMFFTSPYYLAFRVDCALIESHVADALASVNKHESVRLLLGSKPRQLIGHGSHEGIGKSVDWQKMTPEQIRETYRRFMDSQMLLCFKMAFFPSSNSVDGYADVARNMPALKAAIKEGWKPIPAVRLNRDLWNSRYGDGLKTYIFTGNQTTKTAAVRAAVDNKYLGSGSYLFSSYDGGALANTVSGGRTQVSFNLNPKKYMLLKAQVRVPGTSGIKGTVAERSDFSGGEITADITAGPLAGKSVSVRIPEDGAATLATVNGRVVAVKNLPGEAVVPVPASGPAHIRVAWKSKVFTSSASSVLDFPFTAEDKPACTIVVPDNADEWDAHAASRISDYFAYYMSKVKSKAVKIPVKRASQVGLADTRLVVIGGDKARGASIKVNGGNMYISAPKGRDRLDLVFRLMSVLDNRYVYYGRINGTRFGQEPSDDDTKKMRQKGGLSKGGFLD